MKLHRITQDLLDTNHRWSILFIGCGGTGSHMLNNLAMINKGLEFHHNRSIYVTAMDPDNVEEQNIGRQLFSEADIGKNKADILIQRINRFYGLDWDAKGKEFYEREFYSPIDFVISAVDNVRTRKAIRNYFMLKMTNRDFVYPYMYWLDMGNDYSSGQVILGYRSKDGNKLPDFFDEFGEDIEENKNEPSCSAVESLAKQDMFINKIIADFSANMLWKLLTDFTLEYRGMYINIETLEINHIPV